MTISIDSNIISALWNDEDTHNIRASELLRKVYALDALVISGAVYSELMAGPLGSDAVLDEYLVSTKTAVDWSFGEADFREAGRAFRELAERRRRSGSKPPRRILADFLIGAHSLVRGYTLLTLDEEHYSLAFPKLKIFSE